MTLVVMLCGLVGTPAEAQLARRSGGFGGVTLSYWVAYPEGYMPGASYPTVLVFSGGPQTIDGAARTVESDWREEASRRGYVVVAPGTPDGNLFFQAADRVFPDFLDYLVREFTPEGGTLHVAGHSNGGSSAFHVAALYPAYFATVTGYPGLLNGAADAARIDALTSQCIFMHVGDRDPSWRAVMRSQADEMERRGMSVQFAVEVGQVHRLRAQEIDLSRRLFDQIDGCN